MHCRRGYFVASAFLAALSFWASFGCSGDSKPGSLTEAFLSYEKQGAVTFTISGDAKCDVCQSHEVPVTGMQIEIAAKEDPVHEIAFKIFGGLGPFQITDISAKQGATIQLLGTLFREGSSGLVPLTGYAEVQAPDESGQVVSAILQFPSKAGD